MISHDLLDRIEAFKGMNDQQLSAVMACCSEMDFKFGDRLFAERDDATHLWFVVSGKVDLRFEIPARATSQEHTVSSVKVKDGSSPAKVIGWSCFVAPFRMRLSAYCASSGCKVVRMKKDDLVALFEKDPHMGYLFMSHMVTVVGHRFQNFQDYIATHLGQGIMHGW
jgi:CRP-like cAMP-binding protein